MGNDTEYSYELKIPKERIAVLIGKKGDVKKEIEGATHTKINIDSDEGDVFISGEDAIGMFTAREIIKAIARGFNPEIANRILKQDYCLETISIGDFSGRSKKKMIRLRGRAIGEEGKARRTIETLTETDISVYGKTISIIGEPHKVHYARRAIESILSGSEHSSVYRWLEKKRKEFKRMDFEDLQLREEKK